jgi:hypothetical protein
MKTAQVAAVQANAPWSLGRVESPHSLDPKQNFATCLSKGIPPNREVDKFISNL